MFFPLIKYHIIISTNTIYLCCLVIVIISVRVANCKFIVSNISIVSNITVSNVSVVNCGYSN